MKVFISIFILTFGVVALGFAQSEGTKKPTTKELKNYKPQLMDSLRILDFETLDAFLVDTSRVFFPEGLFQERDLLFKSQDIEKSIPGIYSLPDPQSRMPIKVFDDSVNYTILRKEYR